MADFSSKSDAWVGEWTARWDAMQDAYVPHRREVFALMADILVEQFPERCRVIDLGAGAGTLAQEILNRHPNASALCLDVEPFLLEAARRRLKAFSDRAKVVRLDLREEEFTTEGTESTEKDGGRLIFGGPRATRPTSPQHATSGPNAHGENVGRVALGPPSCFPEPSRRQDLRSGASGGAPAEGENVEAVAMTTMAHWFGEALLGRIYAWASCRLVEPTPPGTGGLLMIFDHIPPDDQALARLALEMNEAEITCRLQQSRAPTWEEFWDALGAELESLPSGTLGEAVSPRPTAARVWGTQDGPETGHPLTTHRRFLHAAGFRHTAVLWRYLSDALLLAQR